MVRMLLLIMAYLNKEQVERIPDKWEIEHIFPQKWHDNYNLNVSNEKIKEMIEHIGNKIPFEKKLNIEASNGYFGKKKNSYKNSKISVVVEMSESLFEDWGLNNIEARDIEISNAIQKELKKWIEEYDSQINDSSTKNNDEVSELLKRLNEFEMVSVLRKLRMERLDVFEFLCRSYGTCDYDLFYITRTPDEVIDVFTESWKSNIPINRRYEWIII